MKKLFTVMALAAILIMGGQAMAQTRGALLVSAAFPLGDYGDFDDFDDFALMSADDHDAGAGVGFSAGLKWYFNVGVKGLGVMLSVDGIYNGANSELRNAYREMATNYNGQFIDGSFNYIATPKIINVPLMLGLNYIYHFNPNFGLYVEAGAGANMRCITRMESVAKGGILGADTKVTTVQKYDLGFSFAYQAGIGFEIAKNLVVGCSFYDLGGAVVKGDETIVTKPAIGDSSSKTNFNTFGSVHPYMILARIGFSF